MLRKICKSLIMLFLVVSFALVMNNCGSSSSPDPDPIDNTSNDKWTIIAFLDGNIDLDAKKGISSSFILDELHDFEDIGSSDNVQIVALYSSIKENGVGRYYHIEHHPNDTGDEISSYKMSDLGSVDMSDYRTLRNLINMAVDEYPADKYILYGSGHGGGWRGVYNDDIQNSRPYGMSMDDYAKAISESKVSKFDVIIFNACLMSMVEVGYQLRNLTDYIVASQVSISADNVIGVEEWLGKLNDNPAMSNEELVRSIATASYNEVMSRNVGDAVAFNHSITGFKADANAFETFAVNWKELHDAIVDNFSLYYPEMFEARASVHDNGLDQPDYIDVILYLEELRQKPNISNTQQYINLINEMIEILKADIRVVVYNNLTADARRDGIAIYFPAFCEENTEDDKNLYNQVDFHEKTKWGDHATLFVDILIQANITSCSNGGDDTKGSLQINSTPLGAKIFLNNQEYDYVTPQLFTAGPGTWTVTLTLAGYQDWEDTVQVTAGQTTTVNATLVPTGTGNNVQEVEPNNSRAEAQSIAFPSVVAGSAKHDPNEGNITIPFTDGSETVPEDMYKITLNTAANVSVTLSSNNTADFDLFVIDDQLKIVDSSSAAGKVDEVVSGQVQPGIYYLLVDAYDNVTAMANYTLTVEQQ